MTAVSRKRLEYACQAFLTQMARSHAAVNPDQDTPVKALTDYPPEQRSMLMKAVGQAIKSTQKEADNSFQDWLSRQAGDQ